MLLHALSASEISVVSESHQELEAGFTVSVCAVARWTYPLIQHGSDCR